MSQADSGPKIEVDGKVIQQDGDCYVIAEIGHNHQGELQKCKDLIKAAVESGADAVKLQKRNNRKLFTKAMYDKPYDNENSYGETYGEHRDFLEFGLEEHKELIRYCKDLGVTFFSTPFDYDSADFLEELEVPLYKIASGDVTNLPLIKYVAGFGKPIIVSTGAASIDDVQRVYDEILPINPNLILLQCTATYPTEFDRLDLRVIETFRSRFPKAIAGLSAHDNGIAMSPVAYVLGARVIEKHFTLNRAWKGTDHKFSLEPIGLKKMVRDLRRTRIALGDGTKNYYDDEKIARQKMGKKLVAARDLPEGHTISREDILTKSPGDGLPPYEMDRLVGMVTAQPISEDDNLDFNILKDA